MRALAIFQAILMMVIALSLVAASIPWAIENIEIAMDLTELKSIKSQFDDCNERIIETARTGSTNKCIFNIKRGEITGRQEGIYYNLLSNGKICDASSLTEIDPKNHIWQECNVSGNQRIYGMLWKFPSSLNVTGTGIEGSKMQGQSTAGSIGFGSLVVFKTLSLSVDFQYQSGEAGKIVEMSRVNITDKNVTLRIKIY